VNINDFTDDERKAAILLARFYIECEEYNRTLPGRIVFGAWTVAEGYGMRAATFTCDLRSKAHHSIRALGFQIGDHRCNTINQFVMSHMRGDDVLVSLRDLLSQLEAM
jgi:hypothetical protein